MSDLIARLEAATEGSRQLDAEIYLHICGIVASIEFGAQQYGDGLRSWVRAGEFRAWLDELPRYTTSIDAALTLVPEGWQWMFEGPDPFRVVKPYCLLRLPGTRESESHGATAALATCIAVLKAREAMQ